MILLTEELLAQQANDGIQAALLAAGMTAWELPKPPTGPRRRVSEQVINRMRGVGPYRLTIQEHMGLDTIHVMGEGPGGLWAPVTVTWEDDYSFRVDSLGAQCTRLWLYRFTPRHVPTPTVGQRLLSADLNRVLTHSRLAMEEIGDVLATASGSCAPPVPPGIVGFSTSDVAVDQGGVYTLSWATTGTAATVMLDGVEVSASGSTTVSADTEGTVTHTLTVTSEYGPAVADTLTVTVTVTRVPYLYWGIRPTGPATSSTMLVLANLKLSREVDSTERYVDGTVLPGAHGPDGTPHIGIYGNYVHDILFHDYMVPPLIGSYSRWIDYYMPGNPSHSDYVVSARLPDLAVIRKVTIQGIPDGTYGTDIQLRSFDIMAYRSPSDPATPPANGLGGWVLIKSVTVDDWRSVPGYTLEILL